jgi:hypothetical protein
VDTLSTEEEANRALKLLVFWFTIRIGNLISIGLVSYGLFLTVSSTEPLTRWAVFSIAWNVASFLIILMLLVIEYLIARIRKQINSDIRELSGIASGLIDIHSIYFSFMKDITDNLAKPLDKNDSKVTPT